MIKKGCDSIFSDSYFTLNVKLCFFFVDIANEISKNKFLDFLELEYFTVQLLYSNKTF